MLPDYNGNTIKDSEAPSSGLFQCQKHSVMPDGRKQLEVECINGTWKDAESLDAILACVASYPCVVRQTKSCHSV